MGVGVDRGKGKSKGRVIGRRRVLLRGTQLWLGVASASLAAACALQNPGFSGADSTASSSESSTTSPSSGTDSTTQGTDTTTDGGSGSETGSTGSTSGGLTSAGPSSSGGDTTTTGGCEEEEKTDQLFLDKDKDGFGDFGDGNPIKVCPGETMDGYADNNEDCDDSNDSINPGASELCDEVDNNCNGIFNEYSNQNQMCGKSGFGTCYLDEFGGHYYFACSAEILPSEANDKCKFLTANQENSYHIVINSEEENNAMDPLLKSLKSDASIGLLDDWFMDKIGGFRWVGDDSKLAGEFGDPLKMPPWADDKPDKQSERCTKIRASDLRWDDIGCIETNPFICEAVPYFP
ncbi:MAG TPA: hypothetical protein ENJ18_15815 [Nannocystis exedens]|nr:hypothetical protein [Nannocystis exedens]